ncbi:MAG: hypothetical protein CSA62_06005 [Planctomycetota bacterium]|nr:MAG: hypothetical protein CSA62_06005 [Planctomycetota bacterium]
MSQQDQPFPQSAGRDPRSKSAGRSRQPSPKSKRSSPPWVYLVLALVGVLAIFLTLALETADKEAASAPVPLFAKVVGRDQIKMPKVTVNFHPASDPESIAHTSTTDYRGIADLPKEKAKGRFFVVAKSMTGTIGMGQTHAGNHELTIIELLPPKPVIGKVVDAEGKAIEGAKVTARFLGPGSPKLVEATSKADGEFQLYRLSTSLQTLLLQAEAKGFARQDYEYKREASAPLIITLARTMELQVRILDSNGKPIEDIRATVQDQPKLRSVSDMFGLMFFPNLVEKKAVTLQIEDPKRTYRFRDDLIPRPEPYDLVLEEPATLEGIVVDAKQQPLSGITIKHRHGPRAWVRTSSGPDGSFRIGDLPSGEVWLEYELGDGTTKRFTVPMQRGSTRSGYTVQITR